MSLQSQVLGLLDNAGRLCEQCPDAAALADSIKEMYSRLKTPLRVAVAGIMKAGKSTFMNALMGVDLLCTGNLETTYTVCWFRYGEQPRLTICFRDGEELEAPLSDLERWSVRDSQTENPRINDVKYLIIYYPSKVLQTMEFIDTPGLNSMYGTDAQNTLDFLSIQSSKETLYEAGKADAVIYAFSRSAGEFDANILQEFHRSGMGTVSPINSVGILTKTDVTGIWDMFEEKSPVESAGAVASSIMENEEMKKLLFTALPVCAKVCEGYAQMQETDWEALRRIAGIDPEELKDLLFDAEQFAHSNEDGYTALGGSNVREHLMELVGQYGILKITSLLRAGQEPEEIGVKLQNACGIEAVRKLLLSHFGNRTFLIKTQYIFSHLRGLIRQIRKEENISDHLRSICRQVADHIDELMTSVQTLKELKVLQIYYNGQLQFFDDDELQDFLRITGEYGRSVEDRLGITGSLTVLELANIARRKAVSWNEKANGCMLPGSYIDAASIIARSYEQMYYHLNALSEE